MTKFIPPVVGTPQCKDIWTRSLSFHWEMTTLFRRIQVRGEDAWTLSTGSFPDDLSMKMPSLLPNIGNTQNDAQQETYEDVKMEELMSDVMRKQPGPS